MNLMLMDAYMFECEKLFAFEILAGEDGGVAPCKRLHPIVQPNHERRYGKLYYSTPLKDFRENVRR